MRTMKVPKGNGKYRVCYCPTPEEKRRLRSLVPQLNLLAEELDVHHVQHGFTEGRSPVTNAKVHVGYSWTVSFDLQDFFDTVTLEHIKRALPEPKRLEWLSSLKAGGCECFVDGAARQGLPTSPALANIAASPMDRDIMALCPKGRFAERPYAYSRYADDLTFSTNQEATVTLLLLEIPKIVERHGFKINPSKTKVQCAKAGRRIITGISVGQHDISIPREVRRRIRAGNHQDEHGLRKRNIRRLLFNRKKWNKPLPLRCRFYWQLNGLREWARLKPPASHETQIRNPVARVAAVVVNAVCGENICHKLFGKFSQRKLS